MFVAAGIALGALWGRAAGRSAVLATSTRPGLVLAVLAVLVAWNAAHWPPLTAPDGGWPPAQAAAARLEKDAAGSSIAIVPLFAAKGTDAYGYPLALDGISLSDPGSGTTVAVLCNSYWLEGCGGAAEAAWLAQDPARSGLVLVDRFAATPDRLFSVYRRAP